MQSRRTLTLSLIAVSCGAIALLATPALSKKAEIYTGLLSGTAAGGYDVVSYFTDGKPVRGSSRFSLRWKGASWQFANAINLEKFKAQPEAFAPQYGGHCAYGVAQGYLVKGEPLQWKIVNGKLYLNYSADVQATWLKDIPGYLQASDGKWPSLLN